MTVGKRGKTWGERGAQGANARGESRQLQTYRKLAQVLRKESKAMISFLTVYWLVILRWHIKGSHLKLTRKMSTKIRNDRKDEKVEGMYSHTKSRAVAIKLLKRDHGDVSSHPCGNSNNMKIHLKQFQNTCYTKHLFASMWIVYIWCQLC